MAIVEVFTCPSVKHWHVHHLNSGKYIIEILTWPSLKNWHAYLWINLIWKEGADLLKFCLDLTDYLLTCPSCRYCLLLKYAHHLSTDMHHWTHACCWSIDMPIIKFKHRPALLKYWHAHHWNTCIDMSIIEELTCLSLNNPNLEGGSWRVKILSRFNGLFTYLSIILPIVEDNWETNIPII